MELLLTRTLGLRERLEAPEDAATLDQLRAELEAHRTRRLEWRAEAARHDGTWVAIAEELELPELGPQADLVPLGRDPRSGLHEFAHLPTGAVPERDEAGILQVRAEHGVVLALLRDLDGRPFFLARDPLSRPLAPPGHGLERLGLRAAEESELSVGTRAIEGFEPGPRAARSVDR